MWVEFFCCVSILLHFFQLVLSEGFAFEKLFHRSKEIETQKSQSDSERIIPTYACFYHCTCSYLGSKGKASINNRIRSFVSLAAIPRQHTCFSNDGEFCCCFSSECSFPKCSHECGYKRDILLPVCSEPRECVCINATLDQSGDWMWVRRKWAFSGCVVSDRFLVPAKQVQC